MGPVTWAAVKTRWGNLVKRGANIKGLPWVAAVILVTVIFMGIAGFNIAPHDPEVGSIEDRLIPPFWQEEGSSSHVLGTDQQGRDILSRLMGGARVSLIVGLTVVFIAGSIGTIVALLAGYLGGWTDRILSRITDGVLSMPFLLIAVTLAAVLGPGMRNLILVLVLVGWAGYARILRGEVLRVREADFVKLAQVAGCSTPRILIYHIFPNIMNSLVVLATLQLGSTIIAAAALSFLGLGIPPPTPDWGSMLADGRNYITTAWWLCAFPGVAIVLTVLSLNLLGEWLRIRLDPKFRQI